jgi:hypothetical protein
MALLPMLIYLQMSAGQHSLAGDLVNSTILRQKQSIRAKEPCRYNRNAVSTILLRTFISHSRIAEFDREMPLWGQLCVTVTAKCLVTCDIETNPAL